MTLTRRPPHRPSLFPGFFLGGFESSTHRNASGTRLDLIAATGHDRLAHQDYAQLVEHGLHAARDSVRWHLIEGRTGQYDWSSLLPMLHAAEEHGLQMIWDLFHYGWPDGLDIFSPAFVDRFAAYAAAFTRLHVQETGRAPALCLVNEISFLAWAGGDMGRMGPHCTGRGWDLKRQLVRTAVVGSHAVRQVAAEARLIAIDPLIHIAPRHGHEPGPVEAYCEAQWQAWDMLAGRQAPELGGSPAMIDILGVNYYWNNQWLDQGEPLSPFDRRYRPLHDLLAEAHARYGRPVLLAETSIEGSPRPGWLAYISEEVRRAMQAGVAMEGICLYPIISHPGWDEDRYCANGLFEMDSHGARRAVHTPLAQELARQQQIFAALLNTTEVTAG